MGELPIIGAYTNPLGWLALISLIIISWVRSWWWTSKQVDVLVKYYEKTIDDKDKQIARWEEAYNNADARADEQAADQRKLIDSVATNNALIQTLIASRSSSKETIT